MPQNVGHKKQKNVKLRYGDTFSISNTCLSIKQEYREKKNEFFPDL
jgi:hypothetical protein